ncbi:MAG TPA: hypothetical protein VEY67_06145, partial [Candidatus Dormibacteraeota bacterium]|nr:hypothetical protein [Candidatus Dormibacteraeota bacterium]
AGVRRHERRRRRAEEQLAEAEANLARVEDIVGELRPQARRLAQQAEQQATRADAAAELAAALVRLGHGRWHEAAGRVRVAGSERARAERDADDALRALTTAEAEVAAVTADLGARAIAESERRSRHDEDRAALTSLLLREARLASDLASVVRDRDRAEAERAAAEAEVAAARRALAVPLPPRDLDMETELADAERSLSEALTELGALRAARQARGEQVAALRRAEAARNAEVEAVRRRAVEASRRSDEEAHALAAAVAARDGSEAAHEEARRGLAEAVAAYEDATRAREAAARDLDAAEAERRSADERASRAAEALAAVEGQASALEARLEDEEARGIARAARRLGGRRVDEDLAVEPGLRAAVEAALDEAVAAYVLDGSAVPELAGERGSLVLRDRLGAGRAGMEPDRVVEEAERLGGGSLADAVRRDPTGAVTRLLERSVWVPDLAAALELQRRSPSGWTAVVRDGSAVVGALRVRLGRRDAVLERRADLDRLAERRAALSAESGEARGAVRAAEARAGEAREILLAARTAEATSSAALRRLEETERAAARALEGSIREAAWHEAQAARLASEAERAREAHERLVAGGASDPGPAKADGSAADSHAVAEAALVGGSASSEDALSAWERRATESRQRRDRLSVALGEREALRRHADAARARAEAAVALGEERIARVGHDLVSLAGSERALQDELERLTADLADAGAREAESRRAVEELRAADSADRARLSTAEARVLALRDRSRSADDRRRAADVAELEARVALEGIRESLLVELAGLGDDGWRALANEVGTDASEAGSGVRLQAAEADDAAGEDDRSAEEDDAARFRSALERAGAAWSSRAPDADPPSPGRLASLRRRVHELGSADPHAAEEYAAVRERLTTLETQAADLRDAIVTTRRLIEELDELIADQFRTTFRALESAFDRRFQQLFGGGFARLTLTDPGDLAATGVESVARPPGKRAQPLAMLSGGERALTAVALLFAMLEVRPVPFCVLDEVDAALDEANVGRFTDALRQLAAVTQCIVITHNRGTIEAADALYGVTVGDDSVSRVISLRLEEAQAIADRAHEADVVAAG